jgi:hypothetical protein
MAGVAHGDGSLALAVVAPRDTRVNNGLFNAHHACHMPAPPGPHLTLHSAPPSASTSPYPRASIYFESILQSIDYSIV